MLDNIFQKLERFVPEKHRWILGHEGFRRYFSNTGWLFAGQIIFLLLSFFIGAWIARYLGPEKYGLVSFVVAFSGLFSFITSLGVDGIINRELVSHPEKRDELLGTGFRLRLVGSIFAFLVLSVTAFLAGGSPSSSFLIILYGLSFFFQAPFILITFFYSQVQAKQAIKAQLAAALISSVLKVVLILSGGGVLALIIIYVFDSLWQAFFLLKFYQTPERRLINWQYRPQLARLLWRDSWPLMLSSAAAFIYLRIDQVMIGWLMGETAVGIYAAGVKLTEVFYFIPGVICGSLFPAIVNARNTNQVLYRSRLRKLYWLLGLMGFGVAFLAALFARPFITLVFGGDYLGAIPVLQLYIWSSVGLFLGSVVFHQLTAENRTKEIFAINITTMVVNVALNLYLIPRVGLIGAALATLVAYGVAPIWLAISLRKKV